MKSVNDYLSSKIQTSNSKIIDMVGSWDRRFQFGIAKKEDLS